MKSRTQARLLLLAVAIASLAGPFSVRAQVMTGPNKITKTLGGVTFDSAYDNGSLLDVTSGGMNFYNATLYSDTGEKGTSKYWFRFRLTGIAGRTVTINLDHSENPRPALRTGTGPWRRMTQPEAPTTGSMVLTFTAAQNSAEVAFFEPLGYGEINAEVDRRLAKSAFASEVLIGESTEQRALRMITVEDLYFPRAGKRRIWLHSRVHAGEVTASHAMLGFLDQVLANNATGRRLREHCLFTVVPQVNADGIARGLTRWDAQGIDLESEWCFTRPPTTVVPGVAALKSRVDAFMASPNPISVALNLHSTRGVYADSFFFKHLAPSVSPAFVTIQQNYIDAVNAASPLFNNASPQTSQLNACTFIESYFWNNYGESVMALTHEGHYHRRQTDNDWITGADYREVGAALASGLQIYYPLPAGSEPDLTYPTWLARFFLPAELGIASLTGENADPDRDGTASLMEYALGRSPRIADAGAGTVTMTVPPGLPARTVISASCSSYPTDLEVTYERSTDLATWTRTPDPINELPGGHTLSSFYGRRAGDGQAVEFLTLSAPAAVAGVPVFYRLKARRLP